MAVDPSITTVAVFVPLTGVVMTEVAMTILFELISRRLPGRPREPAHASSTVSIAMPNVLNVARMEAKILLAASAPTRSKSRKGLTGYSETASIPTPS